MAVSHIFANDSTLVPVESLAQTMAYNVDGTLNYVQVVYNGVTYRQTMSYTNAVLTGQSQWTKQ